MVDISSPTTSDRAKTATLACLNNPARPPPLIVDRCFRMQFNSWMEAPAFIKISEHRTLSSMVTPCEGATIREEAPPEMTQITRSAGSILFSTKDRILSAETTLFLSGRGCPASRISVIFRAEPCPYFVARNPPFRYRPKIFSRAFPIGAAALPAPRTQTLRIVSRSYRHASICRIFPRRLTYFRTAISGSTACSAVVHMFAASERRILKDFTVFPLRIDRI